MRLRAQLNRVVIVVGLLFVLPTVAVVGRINRRTGRRVALRGIKSIAGVCGIRIDVRGGEELDDDGSYVLVPNHTSPLDIAAVLVARPDAQFVAAAGLFRIPLLSSAMRAIGTTPIARNNTESARESVSELAQEVEDRELVVFAEGGIAPSNELLPFKTGGFVIAISSGVPVVPVAISGAKAILPHKGRLRARPGTLRIELLKPIATTGLVVDDRHDLAERVRSTIIESLRGPSANSNVA
jgi:1-acyl-sn-glycerol-3-phosphate acyltransferase